MRTAAALLALLACAALAHADPPRHNVVLLVADDLGFELGCYGDAVAKTPNIDALAKAGTRFTHGFACVSSCSPSRASLYTGLYTHASGQYGLAHAEHNFRTRDNVKSLPGLLGPAGYRTGIIGKVHVLPRSVYPFDAEVTEGLAGNRDVAAMAKKAEQFITDAGDKPFFLVMGYSDPHRSAKNFGNEQRYAGVRDNQFDPKALKLPFFFPDEADARQDYAEYYQSVNRLDQGVGMVLDVLKNSKTADGTLVIFLSDNGIPWPGAKTTLYDPGLRLPLLIASPAQKQRGVVCQAMASWVDVAPTVLDWAGVKAPPVMTGRSLLPVLDEENPKGWDVVYGSHQFHEITMYYPCRMIRTREHKYVLNLANRLEFPMAADLYGSATWQGVLKRGDKAIGKRPLDSFVNREKEELYDLTKDPEELKNVAADPRYADVLKDLRGRLKEWQEKTKDPWVVKYQHE